MRPSWDEYFMDIVELIKTRSTCIKHQDGALIVKDRRILASGYNGAPTGCKHCTKLGCLLDDTSASQEEYGGNCRGVHAAMNALVQAAYSGTSVKDGTLYMTHQPCILCAKMAINAGIRKIIFTGEYPSKLVMDLFKEASMRVVNYNRQV